jgi:branched-chain amino acid transport system permease protein
MVIASLFAYSLLFMLGPGGIISFGHAAWFGIGAYAAALVSQNAGAPLLLAIGLAPVIAGLIALLFGLSVVRLSGVYLAMLSLAFAQIVWAIVFQWVSLTGGDNGILNLWPVGWAADPKIYYWLVLAVSAAAIMLLRRALYAPFGYALRAGRDAPMRAEALGLPVPALRLAAFALAGAAAGLAGGVFAYAKGSVFPTYISIGRSVDALIMVLLGGVETMAGPVAGALAYTGLYDGLLTLTDHWRLVLGAVIVLLVLAFPDGIAGVSLRLWQRRQPA